MTKELMEGYVGVKYRPVCRGEDPGPGCRELFERFWRAGERLRCFGMTPANGGNLSQRVEDGFVITCSGCNLGQIEADEIVRVTGFDLNRQEVAFRGPHQPSSEAMLHGLLYRELPGAGSVVHAHDELATASPALAGLSETAREEPYGTVALARLAAETFRRGGEIIVLKNHGYVAVGPDLERATETVVRMHKNLSD